MKYLEQIGNFTESNLISLDECVWWALELFSKTEIKSWNFEKYKKPLIAGSWNAIVTAKIIFSDMDAIFCDETDIDIALTKDIDSIIIVSASWEKHAPIFAKKAWDKNLPITLITCAEWSSAEIVVGIENTIITPKNREPYTYNTSTYLGWVLAKTGESAWDILKYIENVIEPELQKINFWEYDAYLCVTPDKFAWVNQLMRVKFIELFGRKIARDVFSYEHLKHAITVIPHSKELLITFGDWECDHTWDVFNIPLPKETGLAMMMAVSYYVIGKIQKSHPNYFQENIADYIERANKSGFSKGLNIIIE